MKSKKLAAVVMATTVLATVFAGCSKPSTTPNPSTTPAESIDKDQYLNLVLAAEPKTMDISKATDLYSTMVLKEITEGLTRMETDKDGKEVVAPAGAEKWTTSPDGLKWTFTLRDYNWSDGQKVKASDYVYSLMRTLDPNTASQYAYFLFPIKGAEAYNSGKGKKEDVGIKAIDDKTLEFTLDKATPYFILLTNYKTFLPQREDFVNKYGAKYGTELETLPVNGPFKMTEWVHQNKVTLVKNDAYWDKEKVKLNTVNYKIIKDENSRMNELLNGSLDSASVRKQEWADKFTATGKFNNIGGYDGSIVYQFYNEKSKIFSNAKTRLAFNLALNREDIVKTLYKGLGTPAYGWIPFGIQVGTDEYRKIVSTEPLKDAATANPDAKALLIQGLKDAGLGDDPSKITVKMLESGTDATSKEFAEYYQQAYQKALGIKIDIEYMEWDTFQKRLDAGTYDIAGMAWGADYNDPMTFMDMWLSNANQVNTGYKSDKYDNLINSTRTAKDSKERLDLFKQAEKMLLVDDAVVAPVTYRKYSTYREKYVKNLMLVNFGEPELKYAYTQGRTK